MRLDSANRSFLALMSLALLLGMYVLCGAVGSVLVPLVMARVSHEGMAGLLDSGGSLLPVGCPSDRRLSTTCPPCAWARA
jgi:hypothetical protein